MLHLDDGFAESAVKKTEPSGIVRREVKDEVRGAGKQSKIFVVGQ